MAVEDHAPDADILIGAVFDLYGANVVAVSSGHGDIREHEMSRRLTLRKVQSVDRDRKRNYGDDVIQYPPDHIISIAHKEENMIKIKVFLAKVFRKIGALELALSLVESAQKDVERKIERLKQEIQKATQEGTQRASQPNTEEGE